MNSRNFNKNNKIKKEENFFYLNDLLNPETNKGVRFPSQFPIPTATFQIRNTFYITPNRHGCFIIRCNPFFLAQEGIYGTYGSYRGLQGSEARYRTYYIAPIISGCSYTDDMNLDGHTILQGEFLDLFPQDIGQVIPNDRFEQYRLVSASINASYTGPLDEAQGIIGGSIVFENRKDFACELDYAERNSEYKPDDLYKGTKVFNASFRLNPEYCIFDNFRHSYYHEENSCLEGIRMLYFPIDNSYEEFVKVLTKTNSPPLSKNFNVISDNRIKLRFLTSTPSNLRQYAYFEVDDDYHKNGFTWYIYGQGLPAEQNYIKVDTYLNFEAIPCTAMLNFIPTSMRPFALNSIERKKIIEEMKKKAITNKNKK